MTPGRRSLALAAALAVGAALAYLPVIPAGWVWDDHNLVEPSPALEDLAGLRQAISTDLYRQAAPRLEATPYWRPLALATYWLDTRLGAPPRALHLGNLLLHALAAALLALALRRRLGDAAGLAAPALAAAWWAFHPQNSEAVAWISCRYDLLCGAALAGLLALPWRRGWGWAALHGLVFLAGLLSKDGFVALLAVVPALDWAERRTAREAAPRWAAMGIATAAWWGARAALGLPRFGLPPVAALPPLYLDTLRTYAVRAVAFSPLTVDHPWTGGWPGIAGGAALLLVLVAAAVWRRRLTVPVVVFLAGLVPAALAVAGFEVTAERYFYVPSIGLALLVGDLVVAGLSLRHRLLRLAAPALVAAATIAGLVMVERRLPDWQDDDAIFAAALRVDPADAEGNLHAGIEAGRRGDWPAAQRALAVAQRSSPGSGRIASAYAWSLLQGGDPAAARQAAQHAAELAPDQPDTWYYLAQALHRTGDHAGELAAIERILQLSPDFPGARRARAIAACEASGRTDCLQPARQ